MRPAKIEIRGQGIVPLEQPDTTPWAHIELYATIHQPPLNGNSWHTATLDDICEGTRQTLQHLHNHPHTICNHLRPGGRAHINIDPRTINTLETDIHQLANTLQQHNRKLELEILETHPIDPANLNAPQHLSTHDIYLAIDDWGTGHSEHHEQQPIHWNTVKLDKTIVEAASRGCTTTIDRIRNLCKHHPTTIAEGIETEQQATLMRNLGITHGQGWLWHPKTLLDPHPTPPT